jgi:hypothetical protein
MEIVDKTGRPFADVESYVRDSAAKGASGFVVIAFYEDEGPEYIQTATVSAETSIATLEMVKTRMVIDQLTGEEE